MASIQELNDDTFLPTILEGVTLVDCWATWCGPCIMQEPIIQRVAQRVGARAKVAKLNVDVAQQTAMKLGLQAIPTVIVFREGRPVQQFVGLATEDELLSAINDAL